MYIVIEIQYSDRVSTLTYQYDTLDEANAKYHTILAAAAVSALPAHAAVILTAWGAMLKAECYRHGEEEAE